MAKQKRLARRLLVLIWPAALALAGGCKQPSSPPEEAGIVTVSLARADESAGLTVRPAGPLSISKTGAANSAAFTAEGGGFSGFTWILDGNPIRASGNGISLSGTGNNTLTVNAADRAIKPGGHWVTVYALKNNVPWSPREAVKFTVIP